MPNAPRKGFRPDKTGHGKGHGRFYIMNLAEGARMPSGVPEHEYSFSLAEAEAWLGTHPNDAASELSSSQQMPSSAIPFWLAR